MKKILTVLSLVLLMVGFMVTDSNAVSNVEFTGGYYYFATKGVTPETGYSFKLTIPTGVDMKDIKAVNQYRADTVYTLQWMTEVESIFSNFDVNDKITEIESKVVSTYIRKSIGFWTLFVDGGITYWDIPNSLGDNVNYEGYYVGLGANPILDFKTKFGAYVLNQGAGQPRLFVFGLNLGYMF